MFTNQHNLRSAQCQDLSAQQSEFSITHNRDAIAVVNINSFQYSTRCRQRFGEHRVLVRHAARNFEKVPGRQPQKFCMSTVASQDSQDRALRTVARISGLTKFAFATAGIDLADNALTRQWSVAVHHSDKLMSDGPFEPSIAACDFKIRVADA